LLNSMRHGLCKGSAVAVAARCLECRTAITTSKYRHTDALSMRTVHKTVVSVYPGVTQSPSNERAEAPDPNRCF